MEKDDYEQAWQEEDGATAPSAEAQELIRAHEEASAQAEREHAEGFAEALKESDK